MYRRQELLFIILVQAAVTLVLSLAEPNQSISYSGVSERRADFIDHRSHPRHH